MFKLICDCSFPPTLRSLRCDVNIFVLQLKTIFYSYRITSSTVLFNMTLFQGGFLRPTNDLWVLILIFGQRHIVWFK